MTFFIPPLWSAFIRSWVETDLFECDVCGVEKPRDEMHHGTWSHVGEVYFCDSCASQP